MSHIHLLKVKALRRQKQTATEQQQQHRLPPTQQQPSPTKITTTIPYKTTKPQQLSPTQQQPHHLHQPSTGKQSIHQQQHPTHYPN